MKIFVLLHDIKNLFGQVKIFCLKKSSFFCIYLYNYIYIFIFNYPWLWFSCIRKWFNKNQPKLSKGAYKSCRRVNELKFADDPTSNIWEISTPIKASSCLVYFSQWCWRKNSKKRSENKRGIRCRGRGRRRPKE